MMLRVCLKKKQPGRDNKAMRRIGVTGPYNFYKLLRYHPLEAWFLLKDKPDWFLGILAGKVDFHFHRSHWRDVLF
jgi:hypothetical protein